MIDEFVVDTLERHKYILDKDGLSSTEEEIVEANVKCPECLETVSESISEAEELLEQE